MDRSHRIGQKKVVNVYNRSDEGLTLETSAFLPFTVANLRFQPSCYSPTDAAPQFLKKLTPVNVYRLITRGTLEEKIMG